MRALATAVGVATVASALLGCEVGFPHAARPTSSLRLLATPPTPPDAVVTIDEELVGPLALVAARGVALHEGTHQVTVEAPGFFPWDRLVLADESTAGRRVDVAVELVPVPR
jgi:hypothetical protein